MFDIENITSKKGDFTINMIFQLLIGQKRVTTYCRYFSQIEHFLMG